MALAWKTNDYSVITARNADDVTKKISVGRTANLYQGGRPGMSPELYATNLNAFLDIVGASITSSGMTYKNEGEGVEQ